ncbi:lytic transglycosylase domain-containing protein [Mycetocola sp. 2940]|uniref:aggregation-promoting factor C-terminal-like domain-containing protein n=1 Tax=Mycetocola sp. 2940 TaxID=3156452 RepID=UPI003395FA62
MGKHLAQVESSEPAPKVRRAFERPRSRSPFTLFVFAFSAAVAVVAVNVVDPYSGATASPYFQVAERYDGKATQNLAVAGAYETSFTRDGYTVIAPPPPPPPPPPVVVEPVVEKKVSGSAPAPKPKAPAAPLPKVTADPGSAQAIAHGMVLSRGWGEDQFSCLVALWNKESGWRVNAENKSSGAYGIPQALPGSKMSTAGGDWATNPATQITWGLGYISGRYGTPCGAWSHSQAKNWY